MSRREDRVTLRQMLDHAEEAVLPQSRARADLESDRLFLLALLKLVGRCCGRVPRFSVGK